jgi:hypothetical protein
MIEDQRMTKTGRNMLPDNIKKVKQSRYRPGVTQRVPGN